MKVTPIEEAKQFKPFNITIESQQEADFFVSLVGATTPSASNPFGISHNTLIDLYDLLEQQTSANLPLLIVELA